MLCTAAEGHAAPQDGAGGTRRTRPLPALLAHQQSPDVLSFTSHGPACRQDPQCPFLPPASPCNFRNVILSSLSRGVIAIPQSRAEGISRGGKNYLLLRKRDTPEPLCPSERGQETDGLEQGDSVTSCLPLNAASTGPGRGETRRVRSWLRERWC